MQVYNPRDRAVRAQLLLGFSSWKGATRMAHKQFRFLGVVAAAMVLAMACGGTSGGGTPNKTFKIGLVTDIGGLNGKNFNHLAAVCLDKTNTRVNRQADVEASKRC